MSRPEDLESVIRLFGGVEVEPMDVYSDIFRLGEGLIQRVNEPPGQFKANPIILGSRGGRIFRRVLFEDTFEETIRTFQDYEWAITNGMTYFGRQNVASAQSKMCAMIFDIDGQTQQTLGNLLFQAQNDLQPTPTYICLSGHGVHLYYNFDVPVDLYPNVKSQLKEMKYALTEILWNCNTSTDPHVQFQGINQGFRLLGGRTKIEGVRTKVFRYDSHPTTLELMLSYLSPSQREKFDFNQPYKPTHFSLSEAAKKWPNWYANVQAGVRGSYTTKRDLYDWWLRRLRNENIARGGHRYFCVMALAVFAAKCDVSRDELERDAYSLVEQLDEIGWDNHFTATDVESALECYDPRYKTFPRADIEKITGVPMPPTKRNGRTQMTHMKLVSAARDLDYPDGTWRNLNGAPTKDAIVREWRLANPGCKNKSKCARDTGLSRVTVSKWWGCD